MRYLFISLLFSQFQNAFAFCLFIYESIYLSILGVTHLYEFTNQAIVTVFASKINSTIS